MDKDLAAVVLPQAVDADALLLLANVDTVHVGWGSPDDVKIRRAADADRGFWTVARAAAITVGT